MIGIYLLVSIFTQFPSTFVWGSPFTFPSIPVEETKIEISVTFDQLNGLTIGSPVLVNGHQVGTVSRIDYATVEGENTEPQSYNVALNISAASEAALLTDSVALQASPMSASRLDPETVVELVSLPGATGRALNGGETLTGYSSLEQFWSAAVPAAKNRRG